MQAVPRERERGSAQLHGHGDDSAATSQRTQVRGKCSRNLIRLDMKNVFDVSLPVLQEASVGQTI